MAGGRIAGGLSPASCCAGQRVARKKRSVFRDSSDARRRPRDAARAPPRLRVYSAFSRFLLARRIESQGARAFALADLLAQSHPEQRAAADPARALELARHLDAL